jgi:hypothetical protein
MLKNPEITHSTPYSFESLIFFDWAFSLIDPLNFTASICSVPFLSASPEATDRPIPGHEAAVGS